MVKNMTAICCKTKVALLLISILIPAAVELLWSHPLVNARARTHLMSRFGGGEKRAESFLSLMEQSVLCGTQTAQ